MPLTRGTIFFTLGFFSLSFILCVTALATPLWLDRESFGLHTKIGLARQCWPSFSGTEYCEISSLDNLPSAWRATLVLVVLGIMALGVAIIATFGSFHKPKFIRTSKLCGFAAAILLAIATLIFPSGFDSQLISGKPFKLPDNVTIGPSYILFILSTLLVFFGEVFASQIIIPGPFHSLF